MSEYEPEVNEEYEQWLDECHSVDQAEYEEWTANCYAEYNHAIAETAKMLAGGLIR